MTAAVATGDWQLLHDNAPTHASRLVWSFLEKHQITQVTQALYSLDLVPWDFWLFPKLKSPLKGKRFQIVYMRFRKIQWGSWWQLENCVRSQGALFGEDWGIIVLCIMFLVSCTFSNKCLNFSYYMAGCLLDSLCIH